MRSVLILLDTVRRDFLRCYGNGWVQTPNIDRLAKRGVVYDNHYVGSLPCMPARRDIITGRQHFLHCGWGGLERYDDSLPKALADKGVFSHLATDHYHYFHVAGENYADQYSSWDFQRGQESDRWISSVDRPALPECAAPTKLNQQNWLNREAQVQEEEYSGPRTVKGAIDWLDRNAQTDDWFLQLELFDPHEPFLTPAEYQRLYDDDYEGPLWDWPAYAACQEGPELIEHMRKQYAALLTMTDRWVGRFLDKLEAQGVFDDTLIILTTDHGTCLSDHGYWMKNYMPVYQNIANIPLIVHWPGGEHAGERSQSLTQTHDIYRTLLTHHGAEIPPHARGIALQDAQSGAEQREAILFGYFGMAVNVTDGRYVYMRNPVSEGGGPLHWYTGNPTAPQLSREALAAAETGSYFRFCYDQPLYRVDMGDKRNNSTIIDEAGGLGKHQLWDVIADDEQAHPLSDPDIEERMISHMLRLMNDWEAPPEQYQRLGLKEVV